jgi:hypothetical protein
MKLVSKNWLKQQHRPKKSMLQFHEIEIVPTTSPS